MSRKSDTIISGKRWEETKKFCNFACVRSPPAKGLVLVLVLAVGFAGRKSSEKTPAASLQSPPKPLAKPIQAPPAEIKTVAGWNVTDFAGHGEVRPKDDQIILE